MAERPTPHSIAVCALIEINARSTNPKLQDFLHRVLASCHVESNSTYELFHNYDNDNDKDTTVSDVHQTLIEILRGISSPEYGPDALVEFFLKMEDLVKPSNGTTQQATAAVALDRASLYGIYVRRRVLGFDRLGFEAVGKLWELVGEYVSSTEGYVNDGNKEDLLSWPTPERTVQISVQQLCLKFDRAINDGFDDDKHDEIKKLIETWVTHYPDLPVLHYMRFIMCLKRRDRSGTLEHFHRYFDYAVIYERRRQAAQSSTANTITSSTVRQYAAIVLTALHHSFREDALAKAATEEAIRISQQQSVQTNQHKDDNVSVAYALSWLYIYNFNSSSATEHLLQSGKSDQSEDILRRCIIRAKEHNLCSLSLHASLMLAMHLFNSDQPTNQFSIPSHHWSQLNAPFESFLRSPDAESVGRTTNQQGQNVIVPTIYRDNEMEDVTNGLASRHLISSAICDNLGFPEMSSLQSSVSVHCNQLSTTDTNISISNICSNALNGSCRKTLFSALQSNGSFFSDDMSSIKAGKEGKDTSVFKKVVGVISSSETFYNANESSDEMKALFLHEWSVQMNDFVTANALSRYLNCTALRSDERAIHVFSQHASRLSRQRNWAEAREYLDIAYKMCNSNDHLKYYTCQVLLDRAMMQIEECPSHPLNSLPYILECLSISESRSMICEHAAALALLGRVFLHIGSYKRAKALVSSALPTLFQHASIFMQGHALLVLAKANLYEADGKNDTRKWNRSIQIALSQLSQALALFKEIDDFKNAREIYYLQSIIYHALDDFKSRDDSALLFENISLRMAA